MSSAREEAHIRQSIVPIVSLLVLTTATDRALAPPQPP
jgi:hypothetical protein